MKRRPFSYRGTFLSLALALWLGFLPASGTRSVSAAPQPPPGPDRFAAILVDYTAYKWWLVGFQDNQVACQFYTDHEGWPDAADVYRGCGQETYDAWRTTPYCPALSQGGSPASCPGYYLHLVGSGPAQQTVGVALPPPVVWLTLEGCTSASATNFCPGAPVLVLTGDEPLPNETILGIEGYLDGEPFACGATCELVLETTGEEGALLEFWAYSSYGDSTVAYEASLRVADAPLASDDQAGYYVDVLGSQWAGEPAAGCAQTWEAFPPVGGLPPWLFTPEDPSALASSIPYEYLAANLIRRGAVDVGSCPDGGFSGGAVSACGLEAALPAVQEWQNRFDGQILAAAAETGVPAQLLKNLFSRESQFWPGLVSGTPEVGLGQLTDNGADTALLWNPSFYEQFCPLVLDDSLCRKRYTHLLPEYQALLRGALVRNVDAFCEDCPLGIDLRQADFSIAIFAETLVGNCEQAGRILRNITGDAPGESSAYEDLWRFTLVNYNAGPGCLTIAIEDTIAAGEELDWENLATHLTPVCEGARDYVEDIGRAP
ncbi:MAG: hypothetical protein FJZ96_03095 [Chloroflexi bacterium]|nr:hypothetical protein [Chloroflexota bacterium]